MSLQRILSYESKNECIQNNLGFKDFLITINSEVLQTFLMYSQHRAGLGHHSTPQSSFLFAFCLLSKLNPARAAGLCCAELSAALQQQEEDLQSRRRQHNVLGSRCHPDGTAWVIKVSREAEVII